MSTRSWLNTMLRARQAQEDQAAQALATARRDARDAVACHDAEAERVDAMTSPDQSTAKAFQAAAAARHAAAATLSAAAHRVRFADSRVESDTAGLADAARARRSVEKLDERESAARTVAASSAAQRDLDEISIGRYSASRRKALP